MSDQDRQKANEMARGADRFASGHTRRPNRASLDTTTIPKASTDLKEAKSAVEYAPGGSATVDWASGIHNAKGQGHSLTVPEPAPTIEQPTSTSPSAAARDEKVEEKTLRDATDHAVVRVKSRPAALAAAQRQPAATPTVSPDGAGRTNTNRFSSPPPQHITKPRLSKPPVGQAEDEQDNGRYRVRNMGGPQQAKPAVSPSAPSPPPPTPQMPHFDSQHHRGDTNAVRQRKRRSLSPDFLVRLATILSSYGALAVHADWLAELAGMDREAFDHEVRMQSGANAMTKASPRELRKELLTAIEEGGHQTLLAPAVEILLKRPTTSPRVMSSKNIGLVQKDESGTEK